MRIEDLAISGALLLHADPHEDERGTFRRVVDLAVLSAAGADTAVAQLSASTTVLRATVRGLHYQAFPYEEAKTIWCTSGSVFDVLVDLRPEQPTYGRWVSVELSAQLPIAVHVPAGVAHGYQTLCDDTTLQYLTSAPYTPQASRTIRWDDPTLDIRWPLTVTRLSQRDRTAPPWPPTEAAR